ncbi:TonB-dependent receptor [Flammeovirgaceae bacterium SG7u.111]|nr:TonB-dependent receptor [Flammeovirgaceae bacterium SG7u.132]WPO36587.1 TonB-dependent receptor [Flammeovirgaceae bacterium SG7u.111]
MNKLLPTLFFLFCIRFGFAQEAVVIQQNYNGKSFSEFVNELESKQSLRFFFDTAAINSLKVKQIKAPEQLSNILKTTFEGSDFEFVLRNNSQVIVTNKFPIIAEIKQTNVSLDAGQTAVAGNYLRKKPVEEKKVEIVKDPLLILFKIGNFSEKDQPGKAVISGYVKDMATGEPVIGGTVLIESTNMGVVTNADGYFALNIPRGKSTILFKSVGMKATKRQVEVYGDGSLNIEMEEDVKQLREVVVIAEDEDQNINSIQMGMEKINMKTVKNLPPIMGEYDIVKAALLLPGVQSVGEGAAGFNVRGGSADQNLILFDKAPVYNSSHFFGFFSIFNPDVVNSFNLYKSAIPANFGGRVSSVFDVDMKDGNSKKVTLTGGVSPVTARLTLEGPIANEKTTFIVSGRSTYSDWILNLIDDPDISNSNASFYDLNAKVTHTLNENNKISLSGYMSNDYFKFNSDTTYSYGNKSATLSWKHLFSKKLYGVFSLVHSDYNYTINSEDNGVNAFDLNYGINHNEVKADFSYYPNNKHKIDFGFGAIKYDLNPGIKEPRGEESKVSRKALEEENAVEAAVYISDVFDISPSISLSYGLRYSFYRFLGPKSVYTYPDGAPRELENIQDTILYGSGDKIKDYSGPEYRLSLRYMLDPSTSFKLSYGRTRQYLSMITNTAAISPTDTWKLSDSHIRPQVGDQVSLGLYKNLRYSTIETSVEVYYKKTDDILDYKNGAELLINEHVETDLINAEGQSYGAEFLIKKKSGKFNGWVSYTYSRSLIRSKSSYASEIINGGEYFAANYDKPHDFTMVANYKFFRRFNASANISYSSGRPYTVPVGKYTFRDTERIHFSNRNELRIPDYFRLDLSLNLEGNHKSTKPAHGSWTLSVYNVTGRKNAYSIFFRTEDGEVKGYQLSIFAQPIPTLTYNFKF